MWRYFDSVEKKRFRLFLSSNGKLLKVVCGTNMIRIRRQPQMPWFLLGYGSACDPSYTWRRNQNQEDFLLFARLNESLIKCTFVHPQKKVSLMTGLGCRHKCRCGNMRQKQTTDNERGKFSWNSVKKWFFTSATWWLWTMCLVHSKKSS